MKDVPSTPESRSTRHARCGRVAVTSAAAASAAVPDGQRSGNGQTAPLALAGPKAGGLAERDERIHCLAYARWMNNGCMHGHALDDWLAAEAEVCGSSNAPREDAVEGQHS